MAIYRLSPVVDGAAPLDDEQATILAYDSGSDDLARKEWTDRRSSVREAFDGEYLIEADGSDRPAERGTGSVVEFPVEDWEGFLVARAVAAPTGPIGDAASLVAEIILVRDAKRVSVRAVLSADGRTRDAAIELASRLAQRYVERLG